MGTFWDCLLNAITFSPSLLLILQVCIANNGFLVMVMEITSWLCYSWKKNTLQKDASQVNSYIFYFCLHFFQIVQQPESKFWVKYLNTLISVRRSHVLPRVLECFSPPRSHLTLAFCRGRRRLLPWMQTTSNKSPQRQLFTRVISNLIDWWRDRWT